MPAITKHSHQRSEQFKGQAREQFDGWADSYDRSLLNHFLFRPSYVAIMEEIALWRKTHPGPFRLLDVGCGTGSLAGLLSGSGWPVSVVGMDYSPEMCARATEKSRRGTAESKIEFVSGDSEHIPFESGRFDLLTCANSFHHYPHQRAVVSEMRRVLRPGGRALLLDGFRDNAIGWFVFDVVITRVERSVYHAPWHEIHDAFESAGFCHIRRRKINLLFPILVTVGDA